MPISCPTSVDCHFLEKTIPPQKKATTYRLQDWDQGSFIATWWNVMSRPSVPSWCSLRRTTHCRSRPQPMAVKKGKVQLSKSKKIQHAKKQTPVGYQTVPKETVPNGETIFCVKTILQWFTSNELLLYQVIQVDSMRWGKNSRG